MNIYIDNKIECEYCNDYDASFEIYSGKLLCYDCAEDLEELDNVSAFLIYKDEEELYEQRTKNT